MIRNSGTPTLEVEPIIAEMRVEEESESEVADKTLSNEIPPPFMILPEFAKLAPSSGTGSVCTDTTARMAIALKKSMATERACRSCLTFPAFCWSVAVAVIGGSFSISFSIPTVPMRVDAILSKSQTKQESKRYNGCENA